MTIGQVAFQELMSKRGGNLVICRSMFKHEHLDLLEKIGILFANEHERHLPNTPAFQSGHVTFRHKSIQEYFAALYFELIVVKTESIGLC